MQKKGKEAEKIVKRKKLKLLILLQIKYDLQKQYSKVSQSDINTTSKVQKDQSTHETKGHSLLVHTQTHQSKE